MAEATYVDLPEKNEKPAKKGWFPRSKKVIWLAVIAGLVLAVASVVYFLVQPDQQPLIKRIIQQAVNGDRPTVPNPLNGVLYTTSEAAKWQDRAVLGVMIENLGTDEVRPQSGLGEAEVVYESLTEGGITRFLALFLAHDSVVGPVRSARLPFLDWISEYDGLYAHVGGSTEALEALRNFGIKDMNQFAIGSPTFERDQKLVKAGYSLEHTMFSSTEALWDKAGELGYASPATFTSWPFKDEKPVANQQATASPSAAFKQTASNSAGINAETIHVEFTGDELYNVDWLYDAETNSYLRSTAGEKHFDRVSNKQLAPKNVIIQFVPMNLNYLIKTGVYGVKIDTSGTGKAVVFRDGETVEGRWAKSSRSGRTTFVDRTGTPIQLNRGQVWIQVVPIGADVHY